MNRTLHPQVASLNRSRNPFSYHFAMNVQCLENLIQETVQMNGQLLKVFELRGKHYVELSPPFWLEDVGLGLMLWNGEFEGVSGEWLRWRDRLGQVILTGAEGQAIEQQRAEAEQQRAEVERQRAEQAESQLEAERWQAAQLAERLRQLGHNPDEV
jgi:hypothetical protein